jgi:hypothetical protein
MGFGPFSVGAFSPLVAAPRLTTEIAVSGAGRDAVGVASSGELRKRLHPLISPEAGRVLYDHLPLADVTIWRARPKSRV